MAKSFLPKRRKRRKAELRNSVRLGLLLCALTAVNVYVFFFRADTSIKRVMAPSSTGKLLVEEKKRLAKEPMALPPSSAARDPQLIGAPSSARADLRNVEGKIGPSDTLVDVLAREGFGDAAGNAIRALGRLVDPKTIRPGDGYLASFDTDGAAVAFEYMPSPVVRYVVAVASDGTWRGQKEEKPLATKTVEASGVIDSSLYESIHKAGESGALVSLLVDIFAWDINFYIDTHPGDRWKVVVEKHYLGDQFYKYGNLIAAEYGGRVGTFRAFNYSPAPGRVPGRFYDDRGNAIAKTLLKSPLRYVRISSKFDRKRFHPILHRTKAHLGVDYAAPVGTPIWASATGKVVECAMKPGSGNTVVIAHGNGLASRYYHLSRFAKGLKAGMQVRQKELIGYVGSTGLSTGPHLHFAVTKNGAFVDPSTLPVSREAPVPDRGAYLAAIKPHLQALKSMPEVVARQ